MVTLRNHQERDINKVRTAYKNGYRRPLLVSPTGSGKTVMSAYMVHGAFKKGLSVCVVVHRSFLIDQISKTLEKFNVDHSFVARGYPENECKVKIASVQTLINRLDKYNFDFIIFDEAHHVYGDNTWGKILNHYNCRTLGVTATPARTGGEGLGISSGGHFDILVQGSQPAQLMPDYLAPVECFTPQVLNTSGISTVGGDYNKRELEKRTNQREIYGNIPYYYNQICPGQRAIAYCCSIDHAKNIAGIFQENNIPAEYVSGKCSRDRRKEVFSSFESGKTLVVASCDLITEGFDIPACSASILLRKTKSLILYLQQCGRSMRPGKPFAYIIDHVGNVNRHMPPDIDREWTLNGKMAETPIRPIITCPECCKTQYLTTICSFCGAKFPEIKSGTTEQSIVMYNDAVLEKYKVSEDLIKKYRTMRNKHNKKKQKEMFQQSENGQLYAEIAKEAKRKGYKKGWVWFQYQRRKQYAKTH